MIIHNFSAGPAILPQEVFYKSAQAVLNFNNSGLSILEISHRSKEVITLVENTVNQIKKISNINKNYEVLFLQGGANLQFIMVPYNLMRENSSASYIDTGIWSYTAIKEAKKFGNVHIVASSKESNYNKIPKKFHIPKNSDFFHFTTNNTIFGTQFKNFSSLNGTLVTDMSSDIFSRNIDFNQFDLIYAGAQKNIGAAGVTLVIINKSLLGKSKRKIPSYLDYHVHISKKRIFNTPNVFGIYVIYQNLLWLENLGGLKKIEKINQKKADLIYNEIDRNSLFRGYSEVEDRSNMNVTFLLNDNSQEKRFDSMWKSVGISGLSGHRYLKGYRASIYNAMPIESVKILVEIMKEFERTA